MDSSTSLPEPTLLPGHSPPLTAITPTDQRGIVIIATSLSLVFGLVSVLLRLFIRREFRQPFFGDDVATVMSMVGFTYACSTTSTPELTEARSSWPYRLVLSLLVCLMVLVKHEKMSQARNSSSGRRYGSSCILDLLKLAIELLYQNSTPISATSFTS